MRCGLPPFGKIPQTNLFQQPNDSTSIVAESNARYKVRGGPYVVRLTGQLQPMNPFTDNVDPDQAARPFVPNRAFPHHVLGLTGHGHVLF